jgi:hypothetical protein
LIPESTVNVAVSHEDIPIPTLFHTLNIVPPVKLLPVESARGTWFGKRSSQVSQAPHEQFEPNLLVPEIHILHSCHKLVENAKNGFDEDVLPLAFTVKYPIVVLQLKIHGISHI